MFLIVVRVMTMHTKQLNELKGLLENLGLKYTDQELIVIAYNIAKFVLVSEINHNANSSLGKDIK
jgi:hypothetical protein